MNKYIVAFLFLYAMMLSASCKPAAEIKVVNSSYWLSVNEPSCYQVAQTPGNYGIYECHFADGHVPSARCLVYERGGISCEYFNFSEKKDE